MCDEGCRRLKAAREQFIDCFFATVATASYSSITLCGFRERLSQCLQDARCLRCGYAVFLPNSASS